MTSTNSGSHVRSKRVISHLRATRLPASPINTLGRLASPSSRIGPGRANSTGLDRPVPRTERLASAHAHRRDRDPPRRLLEPEQASADSRRANARRAGRRWITDGAIAGCDRCGRGTDGAARADRRWWLVPQRHRVRIRRVRRPRLHRRQTRHVRSGAARLHERSTRVLRLRRQDVQDVGLVSEASLRGEGRVSTGTKRPTGAFCLKAGDCASKLCEGMGCDDDHPGVCADKQRACTADVVQYCTCDGGTITGSSSCPGARYAKRGTCDEDD